MALTRLPGFTLDSTSSVTFANVTATGNATASNANLGNLVVANYFSGNGSLLTGITATSASNANYAAYAGNVTVAAQPNITSLGTLTSLSVTGLVTAGNIKTSNIQDHTGTITIETKYNNQAGDVGITGNLVVGVGGAGNVTATYFIGNGSQLTGLPASYSNANVALYLPTYTGNITSSDVTVTGNVTATYFIGNGSQLTGLPASYSNANVAAYLPTYTGNLSAGNILTTGSGGNISGANYVVANYFVGNGSLLTQLAAANIDGQVSNSLIAGTVYTNAQPNITSVGTLTSLSVTGNVTAGNLSTTGTVSATDALITGNLVVNGTTITANVTTINVKDPIIEMGGTTSGEALTSNDGKDRGTLLHYYTTAPVDAFMGWDNSNGEFAFGSNVTISSEVTTFNEFGNVRAGNFIGTLSGAASTAGTVTTNTQPNITSVGTLSSLSVTGNLTAGSLVTSGSGGNVSGANYVVANYFVGDGSLLTGLPASYANSNVANYLPTYSGNFSPSNLVVSTSANLGAVGNVIITGGSANYVLTTDGAGSLSWAAQSGGSGSSTSTTIAVDNFTGNGVADTYTLSVTPTSVNSVFVNYNGAFVSRGSYSLSGANLTFGSVPVNGASIEITTIEGLSIGSGAFTTRTATGDNTTVNYTVTSGATVSSVLVTIDGVLQTPITDYTISGTTLTFTTAPYNGGAIQIRELAVASSSGGGSALLIQEEGSNLTATANTINFVGSAVTASNVGNVVTVTVSGTSNTSIRAQAMTMGIIFGG